MTKISIICACSKNGVIGKDNTMPWRLADDLKNFKKITTNHHVIMGRKTYESIGKPLPNRTNIILTRQKDFKTAYPEVKIFHQKEEILDFVKQTQEVFVIGGGEIYSLFLEEATQMYLTHINTEIEGGDAFFPLFEQEQLFAKNWQIKEQTFFEKSDKNEFDFVVIHWEKG